jgi:hypothetical protein
MRVMDFYLHHDGTIRENWVPIDMLDLFRQMGLDMLGRMKEIIAGRHSRPIGRSPKPLL